MQNKKYKALYKCRVCGHTYSSYGTDNENLAFNFTVDALNGNSIVKINEIHMCKNGSIGIADFCGFKDTVTKADKIEKAFKISMNIPNVDIDSVAQKMSEKISQQFYQETKSVTKDRYKYYKNSIKDIEEFIEHALISKDDYICFFTEEKKYADLELHIVKRKDFKNLERYLKQNPHIRVVSGVALSEEGKITLEEIYMFLEKNLREIEKEIKK